MPRYEVEQEACSLANQSEAEGGAIEGPGCDHETLAPKGGADWKHELVIFSDFGYSGPGDSFSLDGKLDSDKPINQWLERSASAIVQILTFIILSQNPFSK